jgi:hypothetical protein
MISRMEGGDATVAAELSAVAATVAGHVPELSSEIWALLTQDIPELRGDQIVEKLLDASIEENVATLLHVFEHGLVPDEIGARQLRWSTPGGWRSAGCRPSRWSVLTGLVTADSCPAVSSNSPAGPPMPP